jgi:mono/diheme cytochrome c family protein
MSTARVVTFALAATFVLLALDKSGQLRSPPPSVPTAARAPQPAAPPAPRPAAAVAQRGTPGVTPRALPADVTHQDTIDSLPPGKGQEETFYTCAACHGTALIKAQGMSREMWDQSFQLMIDRHGMAEADKADRALIVDYLAASFPPRRRGRGGDNPFLKN